ncbi:transposase [Pedobacter miscanthi]|uniref:Transposase n=1 Tax=Pedobacter miscanthi TaxID=2259170 RepID=A0A366KRI6_9SPHI|nr:transposase [Pedobacter miscanthi]RBQ03764.1 transposase [Pedobacter miscanthi]
MIRTIPLEYETYYHIYNRGNNSEIIFREESNYLYFLKLLKKYILPVADVFAYCLLNNHFHLLIKTKDKNKLTINIEKSFSNLFNAYAKAFNKRFDRTGKLFEERFKRKKVENESYISELIYYIHSNPQKHGVLRDFRDYPYSSYNVVLSDKPTALKREEVIDWFGGLNFYKEYHEKKHQQLIDDMDC